MNIRWGGKGFGGGEATRDPDPTYIDPNDPKGKQQAIHKAETFAEYMAKRSAGTSDDVDPIMNRPCYMLPYDDFPGQPSWVVGGEMEITELEDDSESRTQLFLNPDNTVTGGATDGPPPESLCGLWQCGSHSFQMVLQRTFARDPSAMPMTTGARPMDGQLIYTVTRVYIGTVDESRNGPEAVTGKMIFMPQDEYTPVADPNSILWEDDTYGLSKRLPRAAPAILLIFPRTPRLILAFFTNGLLTVCRVSVFFSLCVQRPLRLATSRLTAIRARSCMRSSSQAGGSEWSECSFARKNRETRPPTFTNHSRPPLTTRASTSSPQPQQPFSFNGTAAARRDSRRAPPPPPPRPPQGGLRGFGGPAVARGPSIRAHGPSSSCPPSHCTAP